MLQVGIRRPLSALVVAVVALALPAVASADPAPTRAQISQGAQFVTQYQITIELAISCQPGLYYTASVNVTQPQAFWQVTGFGFEDGRCTGHRQLLAIPVYASFSYPGWQLGDAVASVAVCTNVCANDTREISVVL